MPLSPPPLPPETWTAFHRLAAAERRVAIMLETAAPAALTTAAALLQRLGDEGYGVEDVPEDGAALRRRLAIAEPEPFSRADYASFFAALPRPTQDAVTRRWGAPEADPAFRPGQLDCGALLVPVLRLGRVAVAAGRAAAAATPPAHGAIALEAWTEDAFRADAVARIAADGTLVWEAGAQRRSVT
jgi:cobaltochelatase CobN